MSKKGAAKDDTVPHDLRGKTIISLDLGRRTGWCVFAPKGDIERHKDSGIFELYGDKPRAAPVDDAERFVALSRFLTALDDVLGGAHVVVFEQVDGGTKGRQTVLYNGYRAIVLEWARRLGKIVLPIPVHTIKRVVAGRGGASKEEVEAAVVKLGYLPFDHDESDAIASLHTAIRLSRSGELEQAVIEAEAMNLGQFKSMTVVKKAGKKDAKGILGAEASGDDVPLRKSRARSSDAGPRRNSGRGGRSKDTGEKLVGAGAKGRNVRLRKDNGTGLAEGKAENGAYAQTPIEHAGRSLGRSQKPRRARQPKGQLEAGNAGNKSPERTAD